MAAECLPKTTNNGSMELALHLRVQFMKASEMILSHEINASFASLTFVLLTNTPFRFMMYHRQYLVPREASL